jgi:hypothetical protein
MIPLSSGGIVSCRSDIYLRGFGIPPSEAAEEVAVVNLNMLVREQLDSGGEGVAAHAARQQVIKFLREYRVESFTLSSPTECGFDLSFDGDDKGALWIVGALGNEPAERIEVRRQ